MRKVLSIAALAAFAVWEEWFLLVAGIALSIGIFSYVVLLGRIEPVPGPPEPKGVPATGNPSPR